MWSQAATERKNFGSAHKEKIMATGNIQITIRANTPREDEEQKLMDAFYPKPKCPDCGEGKFLPGPRGGLSMNIKCANPTCGSEFNVCPMLRFVERIK